MGKKEIDLREIIEGCVNRDPRYEKLLYKTFYGYVSGVAFRYLRDREMIRELVNDAFLRVFSKINDFNFLCDEAEIKKMFQGWIGKITANLAIDKIRGKKKLDFIDNEPSAQMLELSIQPSNNLSFNDVMTLLENLPPIQQVVFNMHAIEGFSHEEIAKELNMLPNTSRVYLKRARAKLILLYQADEHEQRTGKRVF